MSDLSDRAPTLGTACHAEPVEAPVMTQTLIAVLNETDADSVTKLRRVVEALVGAAIDGNLSAIREIFERLDGKAGVSSAGRPALSPNIEVVFWCPEPHPILGVD